MQFGHVTGTKVEKAGSGSWYGAIQAEHLARIEATQPPPVAIPAHTEAPCSINVKFEVEGMQAQATGRGATPEEAVSNLQSTMAKTIVALGTPPPMNRYEKLGRLVTCGLQKAAEDPKLQERFMKAVQLVTLGHVTTLPEAGMYHVASQTDDTTYYTNATRCTCPDRRKHEEEPDYKCKHILAVLLTIKLDGLA